jgi:hypothetical protein
MKKALIKTLTAAAYIIIIMMITFFAYMLSNCAPYRVNKPIEPIKITEIISTKDIKVLEKRLQDMNLRPLQNWSYINSMYYYEYDNVIYKIYYTADSTYTFIIKTNEY